MEQEREITIKYLESTQELFGASLLAEAFSDITDVKVRALKRIGIDVQPGERPLDAWMKHLSELNGVPWTKPVDMDISNAIIGNPAAMRFMWLLA